jgi:error-prone DNA polymerase
MDARLHGHDEQELQTGAADPQAPAAAPPNAPLANRHSQFFSIEDLRARAGLQPATLERLAAADAFRSMGLDRRQALWAVKALPAAVPLPLFGWADARDMGEEEDVTLPEMPLSEHVVDDYRTLRLSLKAHPMQFFRGRLRSDGIAACQDLRQARDGRRVSIAGVILVRQRPGSAKGVVFMTIEDETGVANAVIWPQALERYRKVVMGSRLVLIRGKIQRHEDIIHVVAEHLEDRSSWLAQLADAEAAAAMPVPIANADEVRRPEPGSARGTAEAGKATGATGHPRFARGRHPRDARIIPRSRDFH